MANRMIGSRNITRMIGVQIISFAALLVFIWVDDEFLIPKLISEKFPWPPKLIAGVLDSFWILAAAALALGLQVRLRHKVKILEGMLPICASCKKIRDEQSHWIQIEDYLNRHTHADFSHSICPDCGVRLYGDLYEKAMGKGKG